MSIKMTASGYQVKYSVTMQMKTRLGTKTIVAPGYAERYREPNLITVYTDDRDLIMTDELEYLSVEDLAGEEYEAVSISYAKRTNKRGDELEPYTITIRIRGDLTKKQEQLRI